MTYTFVIENNIYIHYEEHPTLLIELPLVEPIHAKGDLKKPQFLTFLEYTKSNLKIARWRQVERFLYGNLYIKEIFMLHFYFTDQQFFKKYVVIMKMKAGMHQCLL